MKFGVNTLIWSIAFDPALVPFEKLKQAEVDGIEVLRQIKADPELKKMPVIMLTTTDNPKEIDQCHALGCSHYITKPIEYDTFMNVIRQLGLFLLIIEVPTLYGEE